MHPSPRVDDSAHGLYLNIAFATTDADDLGHTHLDVDAIRAALHDLVEVLSPLEVQAFWEVLLAFLMPRPGAHLGLWLGVPAIMALLGT